MTISTLLIAARRSAGRESRVVDRLVERIIETRPRMRIHLRYVWENRCWDS